MKLTDNEIRDIMRYLEQGKPLPERYRFLLFEDKREVELVWNGKTHLVSNVVLPFQVIEQVDEPRAEKERKLQMDLFDMDDRGRQLHGWTNKLIWGDNKLILSSLKNGPLREEIEENGGIKLIYIDPPFDVGADFSMNIEIGDEEFTKAPSVLEELAYRDTWGKGTDSFIAMIYERLVLMRDLLADDGSIYVHCDWRVNSYIRLIMDEVFGKENFRNEIIWSYSGWRRSDNKQYSRKHDNILFYCKSNNKWIYHVVTEPWVSGKTFEELKSLIINTDDNGDYTLLNGDKVYLKELLSEYIANRKQSIKSDEIGQYVWADGRNTVKRYLKDVLIEGKAIDDVWTIRALTTSSTERLGYDTQKPESLIERIILASSNKNEIVADFFCGSGTTLAVAEKLGRKWIGSDLGKFGIHTSRKRLVQVQRDLKKEDKEFRAFEILNLGKYERQHYIGINPNLREEEQEKQMLEKEKHFLELILQAYRAEAITGFRTFHGKKNNRLVAVGPINFPVSRLFVEEIIQECLEKQLTQVDILAFEFEMGLFPNIQEVARSKGVDLALKYIPRDVFDKRAIEKNQVVFHDVSYIEIKPHFKKNAVAIELSDFSVFYNQDSVAQAEANLKNGTNKLVVENGQIIKVIKDKSGIVKRELITRKWTDWIDYWAVDYDFESKKEIIRVKKEDLIQPKLDGSHDPVQLGFEDMKVEYEEIWTGDYIFENEWQTFRSRKNRNLELVSAFRECMPGRRKIAVKVVDIFGNDTMKVIEITF